MSERVVVCAANKYGDVMFIGVRHFCAVMRKNMEGSDVPALRRVFGEVQGFIDQWGVFMDRREALAVAMAAGQVNARRPKTGPVDILFSEDIY